MHHTYKGQHGGRARYVVELIRVGHCLQRRFDIYKDYKVFCDFREGRGQRNWSELFLGVRDLLNLREGRNVCMFPDGRQFLFLV